MFFVWVGLIIFGVIQIEKKMIRPKLKIELDKTIESILKNELQLQKSVNKRGITYEYEDKNLKVFIQKRNNIITMKAIVIDSFQEEKPIFQMEYDAGKEKWIQDKIHYKHVDPFWDSNIEGVETVQKLKQHVYAIAKQEFHEDFYGVGEEKALSGFVPLKKTIEHSVKKDDFYAFQQDIQTWHLAWERNGNKEYYTSKRNPSWELLTEKKEEGYYHVTIRREEEQILQMEYQPEKKDVQHLDLNKAFLNEIKDMETFVASLQQILYDVFQKSQEKEAQFQQLFQELNVTKYSFQEKEKRIETLLSYIEEHKVALSTEEELLYYKIKEEKMKEISDMKQHVRKHPKYEKDVESMMDIVIELLQKIEKSIESNHDKNVKIQERLLQSMQENYKED